MNTAIYPKQKTFNRYDDDHFLLYLNEEIIDNYLPEDAEESTNPITAYQYSGTFPDGGTLIEAKNETYDNFVSGLIRTRYSADEVEAILLNIQSNNPERMSEFENELNQLNAFRDECKQKVSILFE
jgi:hypothetical protein